jgi:hypothetical protein
MAQLEIRPEIAALSFLLGTWRGEGEGVWPPGEPFTYGEEMTFEDVGDTFVVYSQRSWGLEDDAPIHFERGFIRPAGDGHVEVVLAHPLGIAEVAEGSLERSTIDVRSTAVVLTRTGSPVTELRRRIKVRDDVLTYELSMATREVPLMSHVRARLVRS